MSVMFAEASSCESLVSARSDSPSWLLPDPPGTLPDRARVVPAWAENRDHLPAPADGGDACRCGQWEDRLAELFAIMKSRLHRVARHILPSDDLAEDAVQEAIVDLWCARRLPPNPEAWLTRAVHHRSLHLNRCRNRRRRHELQAGHARSEADPIGEASRALEARELGDRIEGALAGLPEYLRVVFILREVEQMDYQSIAERLDIPLGTVRSRLSRSREALRRALAGEGLA